MNDAVKKLAAEIGVEMQPGPDTHGLIQYPEARLPTLDEEAAQWRRLGSIPDYARKDLEARGWIDPAK